MGDATLSVVPNTVPDPTRKYVAVALVIAGILLVVLGVIVSVFPNLGGNAAPALQWGPMLMGSGGFTIWDRQQPAA